MMALNNDDKALIVAMELLRKSIGDNTISVAANTQRNEAGFAAQAKAVGDFVDGKKTRPSDFAPRSGSQNIDNRTPREREPARTSTRGNGGVSAIMSTLGTVAASLGAIAGPAAILASVLSSNVSGMQLLGTGVQLLASVFAPILLPLTVLFAAGLVAASEVLYGELAPAMEVFFNLIFGIGIPVMEWFITSLSEAIGAVADFADTLFGATEEDQAEKREVFNELAQSDNPFFAATGGIGLMALGDEGMPKSSETETTEADNSSPFQSALRDVMRSLRMSIGPRAQISGISDVGRQAQLAALNQDPLEARLMKQQIDVLNRIERAIGRQQNERDSRVYDWKATGAGNYERGSSTVEGGDYGGNA